LRMLGWALAACAAAVMAWLALPGQQPARAATSEAGAEPDYRATAGVLRDRMRDGDAVVYASEGFNRALRRGLAYELRDAPVRLDDPLVAQTAQERGSFDVALTKTPRKALQGTGRLWLLAPDTGGNPLDEMNRTTTSTLQSMFRIKDVHTVSRVRIVLMEARTP
ncbi:hypothetical protein P8605_44085, partial [Streptomyces sp. T-3]|nr:hypothetical protein [Streptomyces sp. T-3]